jgi:uncharacterized protein involved in exopolysaccharide biosynthesis
MSKPLKAKVKLNIFLAGVIGIFVGIFLAC